MHQRGYLAQYKKLCKQDYTQFVYMWEKDATGYLCENDIVWYHCARDFTDDRFIGFIFLLIKKVL